MSKSPNRFAHLLTQAVRRMAVNEDKKIQIIQDELGYALGRDAGGSSIEYWRKGHVPGKLAEVEMLTKELTERGGLTTAAEIEQFLIFADHPYPARTTREMLMAMKSSAIPAASPSQTTINNFPPHSDDHPVFIAGPPISHPRYFFGRRRELKRLFNLFKRRPLQNAAIIGPRRSGKTSLLNYLKNITLTPPNQLRPNQQAQWLPDATHYRWILVDFQDTRLGSREGLLGYLLHQLSLPLAQPCTLDYFLDIVSQKLTTPTVILLDEVGVALTRYPELDDAFWEGLRALATNQVDGNLGFVLAAQDSPDQLAQHSNLGSPFFNIFGYTATLGPFKEEETQELIATSPIPFTEDDAAWILKQSQQWPILLQILCRERLMALEDGETDSAWREDGLRQIEPFRHLLDY